jgi:hypothetical protein
MRLVDHSQIAAPATNRCHRCSSSPSTTVRYHSGGDPATRHGHWTSGTGQRLTALRGSGGRVPTAAAEQRGHGEAHQLQRHRPVRPGATSHQLQDIHVVALTRCRTGWRRCPRSTGPTARPAPTHRGACRPSRQPPPKVLPQWTYPSAIPPSASVYRFGSWYPPNQRSHRFGSSTRRCELMLSCQLPSLSPYSAVRFTQCPGRRQKVSPSGWPAL